MLTMALSPVCAQARMLVLRVLLTEGQAQVFALAVRVELGLELVIARAQALGLEQAGALTLASAAAEGLWQASASVPVVAPLGIMEAVTVVVVTVFAVAAQVLVWWSHG